MNDLSIDTIKYAASQLGPLYGAKRLYLFGSYARGEENEQSDIDIRIDEKKGTGLIKLSQLRLALEKMLGKKVDLLTTDCLDVNFLNLIKKDEILLYEA